MAVEHRTQVLTDAEGDVLQPLIEECRPRGKTQPHELRRTIEAIIWRHDNGAKWRAIPPDLGPWWRAAQTFIRWSRLGVWERLLERAQERGVARARCRARHGLPRRHQRPGACQGGRGVEKRGSPAQRDIREALGRSRGGYGTKVCVIADGKGRAVGFVLAPGQAHELPLAPDLLGFLDDVPGWVVGDRGYAAAAFRQRVWDAGARPAIPSKSNEAPVACPNWIYNNRNVVERLWAKLKEWRAIATRYEKTARSFMGVLCLAAALDWLKG
jgi:transposase